MSGHTPLLTVGLPVFNGEPYLGHAIECILSQSFRDFEFIISDNASTDGTQQICRHYAQRDQRIRYHRQPANMGGARNSDWILGNVRTEFYATASHDDYFSLNYLEACLAKLQGTRSAISCCPEQVVAIDPRGNVRSSQRNFNSEGKDLSARMHDLVNRLGWYAYYGVTRTESSRVLLNAMGRYRCVYGGDVILMALALLRGDIVAAPGTSFFYREPDLAKVSRQMEGILPGSAVPQQPYSGLARDLLQVVQASDLALDVKTKICLTMLSTMANHPDWAVVLSREKKGIADLAAELWSRATHAGGGDAAGQALPGELSSDRRMAVQPKAHRSLRILFQNRSTARSHPGGDTVVMNILRRELEQLGHRVDVALGPANLAGYDLVQAFNFATPEVTDEYARRAVAAKIPLVIAAIYEDWPLFLNKSLAMTEVFRQYQEGRDASKFQENLERVKQLPGAKRSENSYAARSADCLVAFSRSEKERLFADYPDCRRLEVIRLGADHLKMIDPGPALFQQAYGVEDFVLCVGRLETRKNQLMLLKALEHDPITIVFLTGGFSCQPGYVELCRRFHREGKTLFLDRLPDEMLASAYSAARVLCMPSWYELPGLVALEALRFGCPVIASRWGTLPDYVPQGVTYCEPDDPEGIRTAILSSYAERAKLRPQELVQDFKWREAAAGLASIYEELLDQRRTEAPGDPTEYAKTNATPSASAKYDCSIIIPVWNKREFTEQCLAELSRVTSGISYEVIVVDNHSTDDTAQFLDQLGGDIQIIRNSENLGFAKACNQGARAARGRFLVFLNNDTIPLENWLAALVEEVTSHPDVGIVGSKLLYEDDTIQHAGVVFSREEGLLPYHLYRRFHRDHPVVNRRRTFQCVTAACMLIRREIFETEGGFDEGFRNGFEDVDLCLKVIEKNWQIVYQPLSVLYHLESQTPGRKAHEQENALRFLMRWGHRWWSADEDLYYFEDGFMSIRTGDRDKRLLDLRPLPHDGERASWRLVAETERAALCRDISRVKSLLTKWDEWPTASDVLHWGAWLCRKIGHAPLSRQFYQRLLQHHDDPAARRALARMALEEGKLPEADSLLTVLLQRSPQDGEAWVLRGILDMRQAQYAEAEQAFLTALAQSGDRRKSMMGLGMARMGLDNAGQAWNDFCALLNEFPDDVEAIHWLLRAGSARGSWTELSERLQGFVSRNPADLSVRYALAGALIRSGQPDAAQQEYRTLCALAPSYEGLEELAQALSNHETLAETVPQS